MRFYRLFPAAFALRMKVDVDVLPELWSTQRCRAPGRADHGNVQRRMSYAVELPFFRESELEYDGQDFGREAADGGKHGGAETFLLYILRLLMDYLRQSRA